MQNHGTDEIDHAKVLTEAKNAADWIARSPWRAFAPGPIESAEVYFERRVRAAIARIERLDEFLTTLLEIEEYARQARSKAISEGRSWLSGLQLLDPGVAGTLKQEMSEIGPAPGGEPAPVPDESDLADLSLLEAARVVLSLRGEPMLQSEIETALESAGRTVQSDDKLHSALEDGLKQEILVRHVRHGAKTKWALIQKA